MRAESLPKPVRFTINGIATDLNGDVYAIGYTAGVLDGSTADGAFVRSYGR